MNFVKLEKEMSMDFPASNNSMYYVTPGGIPGQKPYSSYVTFDQVGGWTGHTSSLHTQATGSCLFSAILNVLPIAAPFAKVYNDSFRAWFVKMGNLLQLESSCATSPNGSDAIRVILEHA